MDIPQDIPAETNDSKYAEAYLEAGADYVISSINDLKELIELINSRLVFSERSGS